MSNAFICTLGTSVSNGNNAELYNLSCLQRELQKRQEAWDFRCPDFEKELNAKLSAISSAGLSRASAELDILSKQGVRNGDRVVLLCSDGYLGRICGEANKSLMEKAFRLNASDIDIVRVPDLQVKDGVRLSQYGLKNFINAARKEIEQYNGPYTVFLCPNGGYKGVVPFLTLLGMQYHCKVLYTFEFSNSVVTLPPLPYVFDRDLYLRARRSLALLTENVEMREEEYLANIEDFEDGERDLFLGFVQYTSPGYVTPSPLIDAFVNESIETSAMLSRQAFQDLEAEKSGNKYYSFCRLILNSQDGVWRKKNIHTTYTSDLLAIKQCHSTLRLLGFMVGHRYYVARVLQHDDYERLWGTLNKRDFPLETFSQWQPPESLKETGDNLSTQAELLEKNDALKVANDRLLKEKIDLEVKVLEQAEKSEELAKKISCAESVLDTEREKCREAEAKAASLLTEISQLEAALELAEKKLSLPWYRKIFSFERFARGKKGR